MANSVIQLKYSDVTGNTPSSLANGEIAINTYDGKIFYRGGVSNTIQTIQRFTGPAGLNQEVQFNDAGVLGASSNLTFDKSSGILSVKLISVTNSTGDEGGEILLAKPVTNTSLVGTGITVDAYQNKIRFFEQGGTARGAYIDLTECSGGAGTNLLNPGATPDSTARIIANAAFEAANSAGVYANGAFAAANAATATDATQNNSITAAFAAANAATATNLTQNNSITAAFNAANNRALKVGDTFTGNVTIANGNLTISNTTTSVSNTTGALVVTGGVGIRGNVYADAIFDGGIEILTYATNAYNTGNAAFSTANTASDRSLSAGIYANGAFAAANAATATDATQNNSITAAFAAANSAGIYANGAFTRANNSLNANTGGTVTGNVTVVGDVAITGNLVVSGNAFSLNVGSIVANDSLIVLAGTNYTSDSLDIGVIAHYNAGSNAHTGLIRDYITKEWYLFKEYTPEIGANNDLNINDASFKLDTLNANVKSNQIFISNIDVLPYINAAFAKANNEGGVNNTQNTNITNSGNYANGAFVAANSAGIYANGAFVAANNSAGVNLTQNTNITSAATYANGAFVAANNRALKVGDTFTGNVTLANGNLTISNATTSVSNTTGALIVTGGAGIRGNVYADAIFDGGVEILTYATNAYNTANAAFVVANTASDRSLSAGIYANGAFEAANAASGGSAGIYANGAFEAANSAGVYANGAFAAANAAYSPSNPPPATSALTVGDEQTSISTFYPVITTTTSGTLSTANVDTSSLYFVPNTGTFSATVFVSLSDKKYKKNIVRIRDASNVINKLEGVSFSWKSNDKKSFGVIAQQIEKIIPEAVENNENGTKTVNYNSIIPFLIEAIKQQNQEIEKLKKQVESINKKLGN